MGQIRLDKLLRDLGLGTRSELREWIRSGRVRVDGSVVCRPELKLDPALQTVSLDGETLRYNETRSFMMNKPLGVITACEDGKQKTVMDLLPEDLRRIGLFPVGRLDKDTGGLLLLTNDGDFSHRVISPKSSVEKRYYARVDGCLDGEDAAAFREGLVLRDGTVCLPARLEILSSDRCIVTVTEGKYHQVRRMLASRGKPVLELRRLSIGALDLDPALPEGGVRELTAEDLCTVLKPYRMEK